MKLLSVCLTNHDANMTYFDGTALHYNKAERSKGVKRFWYDKIDAWKDDVKSLWNINLSDIDQIVLQIENGIQYQINDKITSQSRNDFQKLWNGDINHFKLGLEFGDFIGVDYEKLYAISHYYAHALSVHSISDEKPDVYIIVDCYGDGVRSWSVYRDDTLVDKGIFSDNSLGEEINNMGRRLGVYASHDVEIAGKVMGLQSYGRIDKAYLKQSKQYDMWSVKDLYSFDRYTEYKGDPLLANYTALDWARTVHHQSAELLINFFKKYAKPEETIFYSGGVAQNVIWNTELRKHFPKLIIPPHSSDEGISIGGMEWLLRKNNIPSVKLKDFPYSQSDVGTDSVTKETILHAAKLLAEGKTVGWYQNHGEIGPRALGNRSILMDPRIVSGKKHINEIKRRENYRPFGASVLKNKAEDYFYIDGEDQFMLFTSQVKDDKLESITHVDGTCRVQTVDEKNLSFKLLLEEFYKLTGCPVLLNTSLNLAGQSLAGDTETALSILSNTKLDCLFVGNNYHSKE